MTRKTNFRPKFAFAAAKILLVLAAKNGIFGKKIARISYKVELYLMQISLFTVAWRMFGRSIMNTYSTENSLSTSIEVLKRSYVSINATEMRQAQVLSSYQLPQ